MELEPWVIQERRVWRHLNTYGGYTWPLSPREAEGPMSTDEVLDEIEWLLGGGMSVELVLQQFPDRSVGALEQAAHRRGRSLLARRIAKVRDADRTWASGAQKRRRTA